MEKRATDLIQRAAARLAQSGAWNLAGNPQEPTAKPDRPAARGARPPPAPAQRGREVVIDRARLAAAGIALPGSQPTRLVEEYRIVKRQLLAHAEAEGISGDGHSDERCRRIIMVTSAEAGDGKTFTAVNLALAIASERNRRVLLIDGDVHRHGITRLLGIDEEKGLFDLLVEPVPGDTESPRTVGDGFADAVLRPNIPNLTVLPSGKGEPGIPELLSGHRMAALLREVTAGDPGQFVIIDAPPCLTTSEPSILASLVGQIVFVVAANQTQEPEIEASLQLISACPTISLLLNKAHGRRRNQFGYYSV